MASAVLDSSVVLAVLNEEPGAAAAIDLIPSALLSSVNLGEVVTKLTERGVPRSEVRDMIDRLECEVVPFDRTQALAAGFLHAATGRKGLSLGDRACVGLGLARELPVYTADRPWAELDLGIDIRLIR